MSNDPLVPSVDDETTARRARWGGVGLAGVEALFLLFAAIDPIVPGSPAPGELDPLMVGAGIVMGAVAVGFYLESRVAAGLGLVFFAGSRVYAIAEAPRFSGLTALIILFMFLGYIYAVLGVFKLHDLRKER